MFRLQIIGGMTCPDQIGIARSAYCFVALKAPSWQELQMPNPEPWDWRNWQTVLRPASSLASLTTKFLTRETDPSINGTLTGPAVWDGSSVTPHASKLVLTPSSVEVPAVAGLQRL